MDLKYLSKIMLFIELMLRAGYFLKIVFFSYDLKLIFSSYLYFLGEMFI